MQSDSCLSSAHLSTEQNKNVSPSGQDRNGAAALLRGHCHSSVWHSAGPVEGWCSCRGTHPNCSTGLLGVTVAAARIGSPATVTVAVTLPFVISHFLLYLNPTCATDLWSVALVIAEMSFVFAPWLASVRTQKTNF